MYVFLLVCAYLWKWTAAGELPHHPVFGEIVAENNKNRGGGGKQNNFELKSRMKDGMGIKEMKSRPLNPGV